VTDRCVCHARHACCRTNKKIPKGPPSPPAPVMHSPNRKVTVKEQQEWKIPPCISNWKNAKVETFLVWIVSDDIICVISSTSLSVCPPVCYQTYENQGTDFDAKWSTGKASIQC